MFWSKFFVGKMFAAIFICRNLQRIAGKIAKIRTCKNFKQHSMCFTFDFDPEAKTIILSCTFSPLCQLFGFFRKRISHVLQLLVEFVHFIFAYATFSRFPSGAFQGLLRQKKRHFIRVSLYLMVILSDGTAILQGTSSAPPDSLAACSTKAKEEHSFLSYFKTLSSGPAWEFKLRPPT